MAHSVKTKDGRKRYALRKQTVEPVFGIIKSVPVGSNLNEDGRAKNRRVEMAVR
jgi:flagellar motor protein MotB